MRQISHTSLQKIMQYPFRPPTSKLEPYVPKELIINRKTSKLQILQTY